MSHMARYYPHSCAFAQATSHVVAGAARNLTTFDAQLTQMTALTQRCCTDGGKSPVGWPTPCRCATA